MLYLMRLEIFAIDHVLSIPRHGSNVAGSRFCLERCGALSILVVCVLLMALTQTKGKVLSPKGGGIRQDRRTHATSACDVRALQAHHLCFHKLSTLLLGALRWPAHL